MKEFLFESTTICKNPRFWIDEDIIRRKRIYAETIVEARKKYAEEVDAAGVKISKTQQKRPKKIYIDDKDGSAQQFVAVYIPCGYLFKATTDIYDEDRGKWTTCRAEIWATIYELKNPFIAD